MDGELSFVRRSYLNRRHALLLALILCGVGGCQSNRWYSPRMAKPAGPFSNAGATNWFDASTGTEAESAFALAVDLEAEGDEGCVDAYYLSAQASWRDVCDSLDCIDGASGRAYAIYHSSVAKLLCTGARFGRFDPHCGIKVVGPNGCRQIAIRYRGFLWKPEDFNAFALVGEYDSDRLINAYRTPGLGVPLVVKRKRNFDEPMRRREQVFAATVALLPSSANDADGPFTLEFFDPVRVAEIRHGDSAYALRRDLSAPYAYRASYTNKAWLDSFLTPGSKSNSAGLYALEPYQPGKIPLIFVHGLLSDPSTWIAMVNELRAQPDIQQRYQIWGFEYPTGEPFVTSARTLREELAEAIQTFDPAGKDAAMSNMVVVGHSMGGLVAKLQITSSGATLWDSLANRPIDQIIVSNKTRSDLASSLFFQPQPAIKRVIFIATPHRGAGAAQRLVGRVASALVEEPKDRELEHEVLIDNNPGVFSKEFQKRIPTSIDMLEPSSCILQAIEKLPIEPSVVFHSIIADNGKIIGQPTDGVVPVSSARLAGAASECVIRSKHTKVQAEPETVEEVLRILREHERNSCMILRPHERSDW